MKNEEDLSAFRWTVDEPEDYEFVCRVYESLYQKNPNFGLDDIVSFCRDNPHIVSINSQFKRNEGYFKSLARDGQE